MSTAAFLTTDGLARLRTICRVHKVLQHQKRVYLKELHARCGVGFTVFEFDDILKGLQEEGLCTLKEGGLGATLVVVNQQEGVAQ